MSPAQAAQATATSRRTIMRAIEAGELVAFRDNRNHWRITAQALEKWASAHCAPTRHLPMPAQAEQPNTQLGTTSDQMAELQVEREARRKAEVEAGELRGKLAATEAERDHLHKLVERLTVPQAKRRSWWPWDRKKPY